MLEVTFYNHQLQSHTITVARVEKQYQAEHNTLLLNIFCNTTDNNYDALYDYFKNQSNDKYIVELINDSEVLYTNRNLTLALLDQTYIYDENEVIADIRIEFYQKDSDDTTTETLENPDVI